MKMLDSIVRFWQRPPFVVMRRDYFDLLDGTRTQLFKLADWAGEQPPSNAFAQQVRMWAENVLSGEELDEP